MEIGELKEILKDFNSGVKFDHDLRKKNWFNIGGKSKIRLWFKKKKLV